MIQSSSQEVTVTTLLPQDAHPRNREEPLVFQSVLVTLIAPYSWLWDHFRIDVSVLPLPRSEMEKSSGPMSPLDLESGFSKYTRQMKSQLLSEHSLFLGPTNSVSFLVSDNLTLMGLPSFSARSVGIPGNSDFWRTKARQNTVVKHQLLAVQKQTSLRAREHKGSHLCL